MPAIILNAASSSTAFKSFPLISIISCICFFVTFPTFSVLGVPLPLFTPAAAGVNKGSGTPNTEKVGKVTKKQIQEIIEIKGNDLNAVDDEAAFNIIAGTARSMGLEVE